MGNPWDLVESAFDDLCKACAHGRLVPLFESDIVGYVYHLLLLSLSGDARKIHLDTRLFRAQKGNTKYDVVFGEVLDAKQQKRRLLENFEGDVPEVVKKLLASETRQLGLRPAIDAELILEFKHFATGFDPSHLVRHLEMVVDDIKKLSDLRIICPDGRAIVVFDEKGYLTWKRRQRLIDERNSCDQNLRIYQIKQDSGQGWKWDRM